MRIVLIGGALAVLHGCDDERIISQTPVKTYDGPYIAPNVRYTNDRPYKPRNSAEVRSRSRSVGGGFAIPSGRIPPARPTVDVPAPSPATEDERWTRAAGTRDRSQLFFIFRDATDMNFCYEAENVVSNIMTDRYDYRDAPTRWYRNGGPELLAHLNGHHAIGCLQTAVRSILALATHIGAGNPVDFAERSGLRTLCANRADDIRATIREEQPWNRARFQVGLAKALFAAKLPAFCPEIFSEPDLSEIAIQQTVWKARRDLVTPWIEHRTVHRARAFSDSLRYLHGERNQLMLDLPHVEFFENRDRERGGTLRDWYVAACELVFKQPSTDPAGGLFKPRPETVYIELDLTVPFNRAHLIGVGELIGFALAQRFPLGVPLSGMFFAKLLHNRVRLSDLAHHEPEKMRILSQILDGSFLIADLGIFDDDEEIPTPEMYVESELDKLAPSEANQRFAAIREGLNRIIPIDDLKMSADPIHLAKILLGSPSVDVAQMRAFTDVRAPGWGQRDIRRQVEWLWQWLEAQPDPIKHRFVRYVTGLSQLPINGFAGLPRPHRITIQPTTYGVTARTCFLTMDLPAFATQEDLNGAMDATMVEFGDAH